MSRAPQTRSRRSAPVSFVRLVCRATAGFGIVLGFPFRVAAETDAGATDRLARTLDGLTTVLGGWAADEAAVGVTWGQLLVSGTVLVLAVAFAYVLGRVLRHAALPRDLQAGGVSEAPPGQGWWLQLTVDALTPPLTVFVLTFGFYAAFAVLLVPRAASQPETTFALGMLVWLRQAAETAVVLWFAFRMIHVLEVASKRWTARTESKWDGVVVAVLTRGLRLILPLVGVMLVMPTFDLAPSTHMLFQRFASLALVGAVGFLLYQLVEATEDAVLDQFRIDVRDNLEARKVYTQVKVLKKIAVVIIVIVTAASMLMVFDSVRRLGTSILASAGVLGIIVGFAAQRSIATVLAGFQIAITQPIRLDDVVIVENEWGRIEEITLTYVVVLIWDQRRLVVPISYFIENPFQNWTRVSAELLGTVFLYVDYTVPLQALRDELDRLLEGSKRWDGRVKGVQVTATSPNGMEVRVLVSAVDASTAWDLRCELREKLIDFLQRNYPHSLPRVRAEVVQAGVATGPFAS